MRNIVVSEFMTLDGIMEAPNKWSFDYWGDDIAQFKLAELMAADSLLLGRITYEGFAEAWPTMPEDPAGFTKKMNSMPKYVVSTSLQSLTWNNSHLISQNVVEEISNLKKQEGQNILVGGSSVLTDTLIKNNLVDELQLLVYPLIVGSGKRMFKDGAFAKLKLVESKSFKSGVVLLSYKPE